MRDVESKYNFNSSEETDILGVNIEVKSEGYWHSDKSRTDIRIRPTTVWGGFDFDFIVNRFGTVEEITIKTAGDFELYDLTESLKWLVKKLDSIEKECEHCPGWYDENQRQKEENEL